MKKFFQEHMNILIAIVVGLAIITLAKSYGREGGPVDNVYRESLNSVTTDVLDDNGGENNEGGN